ncbi:cytochrome P450 [Archangium violaceum]|uniref:cytochrome P450 n=1 Tax=Archangium violaceum TaxID=83451 RepID=UPI00193AEC03|nr:cytochrome P450 [Archangium violaceum]QRK05343.1 cytochrome P450 [Archangium violaceum]
MPKALPRLQEPPLIGSLRSFRNERLELFNRVRRECGELGLFRVGPLSIMLVNSSRALQEVTSLHADAFEGGLAVNALLPIFGRYSLVLLPNKEHRTYRKIMAPTFQPRRVSMFAEPMVKATLEAQARWTDGQEIDVGQEMLRLTMRIVGKTLLGLEVLDEADDFGAALTTCLEYSNHLVANIVPVPLWLPTKRNRELKKALAFIRGMLMEKLSSRRHAGCPATQDFASMLMGVRGEDGQGLSDEQLRDNLIFIFSAGYETSANTLAWTWYLLSKHPEVYERLRKEVDEVLQGRAPTYEDLASLPYVHQVVKEVMRIYPVAYFFGREARRDVEIDGYQVPKGTFAAVCPYTLHRNPEYFPDPERFDPDRFAPEQESKLPKYAYLPFGAGVHACLGVHFFMIEAPLLLATLVQRVHIDVLPGQTVKPVVEVTLRPSRILARVHHRS